MSGTRVYVRVTKMPPATSALGVVCASISDVARKNASTPPPLQHRPRDHEVVRLHSDYSG
jgi:hypothetical protein